MWHRKLAFASVGNGDQIAFDLQDTSRPVIYLSHDDGEGHGYLMGKDFVAFVDNHSKIGCVGFEDWQWLPFCASKTAGIDGDCRAAREWRDWFGLALPG